MSAVREVADYIEKYFQDEYGMTLSELKQLAELKRDGKLIELPFVAMIEKSMMNGEMKPEKDQRFNGRYAAVYYAPDKWKSPLIDICGNAYNRDEAENRIQELKSEAEQALKELQNEQ